MIDGTARPGRPTVAVAENGQAARLIGRGLSLVLGIGDGVCSIQEISDPDRGETFYHAAAGGDEAAAVNGGPGGWPVLPPCGPGSGWRATRVEPAADEGSTGLRVTYEGREGRAVWTCLAVAGGAAVEMRWVIANESAAPLELVDPSCLIVPLSVPGGARIRLIGGDRDREGVPRPEGSLYETFRIFDEPWAPRAVETGNLRSAVRWLPVMEYLPKTDGRDGLWVSLAWSGRWRMQLANMPGGVGIISAGPAAVRLKVAPGSAWRSPRAALGRLRPDQGVGTAAWVGELSPPPPADFPWVEYNTWFAYGIDFDEDALQRELEIASRLGVEIFCVDAGWYRGSGREGHFHVGLGDWRENRTKFPRGIEAFSRAVRSRGLRFGLWFEPERVDPGTAGPAGGGWDPGWLATNREQPDFPPHRSQLCFGHKPAREWAKAQLEQRIRDFGLDWLKLDYNTWIVCDRCDHDHDPAAGDYAHAEGLYEVLDHLRTKFPHLVIENCAAGGARLEPGLASRTHIGWVSDHIHDPNRVRHHFAGASHCFPPRYLNAWIWDGRPGREEISAELPPHRFDYMVRSRMLGAFGLSCKLTQWPSWAIERLSVLIQQYKADRALLWHPALLLTPQAPLAYGLFEQAPVWEAYQYWDPATHRGSVWVFRGNHDAETRFIRLQNLDPSGRYRLTDADRGFCAAATGEVLMQDGWEARLPQRWSSAVVSIARE